MDWWQVIAHITDHEVLLIMEVHVSWVRRDFRSKQPILVNKSNNLNNWWKIPHLKKIDMKIKLFQTASSVMN